jgi:hypothetical protein
MIRRLKVWTLTAALAAAAGCVQDHSASQLDAEAQQNAWMLTTIQDDSVRAAVIAQATVYPHHFVTYGAQLNELGERDLAYLAGHFAAHPGPLNVRRGTEGDDIYAGRVQTVTDALVRGGVAADRIDIGDGMAGGPGLRAERVLRVLKQDTQPLESLTRGGTSTTSSSSSSAQTTTR